MKTLKIRHLPWDSSHFKLKIAEMNLQGKSAVDILEPLSKLKKQKYNLIYVFSSQQLPCNTDQYSIEFICKKYSYWKKTSHARASRSTIQKFSKGFPTVDMLKLAVKCGVYSRYNRDPRIPRERFEELYRLWLIKSVANERSVSNKNASDVFTCTINEQTAGVITLTRQDSSGQIGLLAVDNQFRKHGIATDLLRKVESYCFSRKLVDLRVVTQDINQPACILYEKNGFTLERKDYVYHIWL